LLLAGFVATAAVDPSIRSRLSGVQRATLIIMALMIVTQGVRLIVVDRAVRGARHFLAAGDPASALRVAAEGLWLEPASGELLTTLARAQAVTDQPAAALVTARRAAAVQPSATLSYLIAELEVGRGNPDAAEHDLRVLSQTLPGLLRPHLRLAEIYAQQGKVADAKAEIRRGLAQPSKIANARQVRLRERASARLREMEAIDGS
jgi:Flp pilus assembly protein TadD